MVADRGGLDIEIVDRYETTNIESYHSFYGFVSMLLRVKIRVFS